MGDRLATGTAPVADSPPAAGSPERSEGLIIRHILWVDYGKTADGMNWLQLGLVGSVAGKK